MSRALKHSWKRAGWRSVVILAACVLPAQSQPASVIVVDTANRVNYIYDSPDVAKFGTSGGVTSAQGIRTDHPFYEETNLADVVAVNGAPAKGNMVIRTFTYININPAPSPGRAIGDITRTAIGQSVWEILAADGRPVGTIITTWLSGGAPPPGAPRACTGGNQAIIGGTGAFLGASGMVCQAPAAVPVAVRSASVLEDPQNRRTNGGGTNRYVMQIIPRYVPEVAVEAGQPVVLHADFSPVTSNAPARAGETLILMAAGLGPTIPSLDPGEIFSLDQMRTVSSPVEVLVNGQAVAAENAVGWPGTADRFRVDFKVPAGLAAGQATVQLSAAWIKGGSVRIPVR